MKKKILIGIYAVMLLICAKLAFNYIYNGIVVSAYNQYNYEVTMKPLMVFNFYKPYIMHYNQGNIYYRNYCYENAILSYKGALEANPPQEKECSIRINLALAMIKTMDEEYSAPENVETSLEILYGAREVLLEKDCATTSGDGHSETAEQLKEEIEAIIEQLQQESETESSEDEQEEETETKQEEAEDEFEEDVKETLQKKQSEANQERSQALEQYEEMDKDYNFDSDGYIW